MSNNTERRVGYKSPPTNTKYKPGQSGNPAGRPKDRRRSTNLDDILGLLDSVLHSKVSVMQGGQRKKLLALEVGLTRRLQQFAQGEPNTIKDIAMLIKLFNDLLARRQEDERREPRKIPYVLKRIGADANL